MLYTKLRVNTDNIKTIEDVAELIKLMQITFNTQADTASTGEFKKGIDAGYIYDTGEHFDQLTKEEYLEMTKKQAEEKLQQEKQEILDSKSEETLQPKMEVVKDNLETNEKTAY